MTDEERKARIRGQSNSSFVFRLSSVLVLTLALVLALGCEGDGAAANPDVAMQVQGHVVEVVPRNITEVETLRIREEGGQEWTFTTEGFAGFTPSHLKEHQLFGQSVVVSYVEKDGKLIAVDITD